MLSDHLSSECHSVLLLSVGRGVVVVVWPFGVAMISMMRRGLPV